jgi:hypothetical protein
MPVNPGADMSEGESDHAGMHTSIGRVALIRRRLAKE